MRVGFNHRYHPALRKGLALAREGALGDLMFIRGRYGHGGRLGYDRAELLVNGIRTGVATVEAANMADLEVAASIGEVFADQTFSLVDRTSWAVMQRLGVHEAVTFDQDFSIYRFGPQRRRAFVVHA